MFAFSPRNIATGCCRLVQWRRGLPTARSSAGKRGGERSLRISRASARPQSAATEAHHQRVRSRHRGGKAGVTLGRRLQGTLSCDGRLIAEYHHMHVHAHAHAHVNVHVHVTLTCACACCMCMSPRCSPPPPLWPDSGCWRRQQVDLAPTQACQVAMPLRVLPVPHVLLGPPDHGPCAKGASKPVAPKPPFAQKWLPAGSLRQGHTQYRG
jgi:hypothetical protein